MFNTFIRTKFDVFGTFENFDLWGPLLTKGVIYILKKKKKLVLVSGYYSYQYEYKLCRQLYMYVSLASVLLFKFRSYVNHEPRM